MHACLCDYYGAPEGWLRLYRFTPAERRVEALTYGVISDTLCAGTPLVPNADQHQFTLQLPM